jgi:hypothetical protein
MTTFKRVLSLSLFVLCMDTFAICEEPVKATVCQLKNDPRAYSHKLVEVTGLVSHGFEDFTIFDPNCASWPRVWLEYGGTLKSGTMYCCGVSDDRHRPLELKVENVPVPLVADQPFKDFDKIIQPPYRQGQDGVVVHATLVGRFFAGRLIHYPKASEWGGYGHMGCCTLLAIQEVKNTDVENRTDLDYGEANEQPDIDKPGCGFRFLLPLEQSVALMRLQQEAEKGTRDWSFNDPARVATDTLSHLTNLSPSLHMMQTHESQGHKVYEWKDANSSKSYMVVVSRPYWLSFYSRDPARVAWVAAAAYEASCGDKNTVTRIR